MNSLTHIPPTALTFRHLYCGCQSRCGFCMMKKKKLNNKKIKQKRKINKQINRNNNEPSWANFLSTRETNAVVSLMNFMCTVPLIHNNNNI